MRIMILLLSVFFLILAFSRPHFAGGPSSCPSSYTNWSTSWHDAGNYTTYKIKAPTEVFIGCPFDVTATVTDTQFPNNWVGGPWAIYDTYSSAATHRVKTTLLQGGINGQPDFIYTSSGQWQRVTTRTYTGTPYDHRFEFAFKDMGSSPTSSTSGMNWTGGIIGNTTLDPYYINLAANFSLSTDQQGSTLIPATVFNPAGGNPLTYRWLEGAAIIQASQPVNGTDTVNIPLNLASVPALSIGPHTFTLEVTDGTLTGSETTVVSVTAPASIAGSCGSSSGQAFQSIPTMNLCSAGAASSVTGTGPWNWTCAGLNGGSTASCSAAAGATVATGSNVIATPSSGVSVTFNNVAVGGAVTATKTTNLTPPPNFQIVNGSSYLISTTATFSGNIIISLGYDESALINKSTEGSIKLFHHNGTNWEDVTTSVDTVNNIVYGRVTSLSPFIIAEPVPATPAGGFGISLITMLSIAGYGYWKSRK